MSQGQSLPPGDRGRPRPEGMQGRHRPESRSLLPRMIAIVAGVALVAAGAWTLWRPPPESAGLSKAGAATSSISACPTVIPVTAVGVEAQALAALADEFALSEDADCSALAIQVASSAPNDATAQADLATVGWSALAPDGSPAGPTTWLAADEIVLAAPTGTLTTLGWTGVLTTDQLRAAIVGNLATAVPGTFPTVSIAIGDPAASSVAARAVAGLAMLAYGGPLTTPINYANPGAGDLAVIKLEHGIVATEDLAPDGSSVVTAMTASQARAQGLATVTLGEIGIPVGLVLTGDTPEVASWRSWLASSQGQAALEAAGFTAPDPAILPAAMTSEQLAVTQAMWGSMTTRISTLAVLDTSWSMSEAMPGGPPPKIELLRQYALAAWQLASPRARSGVMTFSSDPTTHAPELELVVPLGENLEQTSQGTHALAGIAAVTNMQPAGGTPLYQAIQEGYRDATSNYREGYVNRVMVMTDGINEDSTSTVSVEEVSATLGELYDPERPVQLIIIALNPDGSFPVLEGLAAQTKGKALAAATLADLPGVMAAAVFEA